MNHYPLIVAGGGCAGFCAAVAAARMGVRTALIEKYHMPGGILTVLGSNSIDQFNNPFIEENKMVIAGIGWELVRRLEKDGFAHVPDMNAPRQNHEQYGVKVNPVAAAKVMDDMLTESGVHLFYGQTLADAETENGRITAVTVTTKAGLKRLTGDLFIDCTGDGDLAAFAGAAFIPGDGKGTFQPGTIRYYPAVGPDGNTLNPGDNKNHVSLDPLDSDAITRAEIAARQMIYQQMLSGEKIIAIAPAVAPREGRRILGRTKMNMGDYCAGRVFKDSVCYSYWFVDIHRENEPAHIQYITHPNTPTIRLSAMIAKDLDNLMMAGRCVSSDRATNSALRVKSSCMAMGQAAGTAAAIALQTGVPVHQVPAAHVREVLDQNGAIIPGKEIPFAKMP